MSKRSKGTSSRGRLTVCQTGSAEQENSMKPVRQLGRQPEALHASEDLARWLARLPEENPNPVMRVSALGIVLYRNPAAAAHAAWRCEVGEKLRQEALRRLVARAMAEGEAIEQDVMLDGVPFAVAAVPVLHESYANLYGRNITVRKRAEIEREHLIDEVMAERDRISALVASMQDEVWFADTQKRLTLANPAAMSAFRLDAVEGMEIDKFATSLEVLLPDGSPRPVEDSPPLRALNGEVVTNEEEVIITPASGERRYRQVSSAPVKDKADRIIGSVSVVRDITDSHLAEEAVQAAEREKALILDSVNEIIAYHDTEHNLVWANRAYLDSVGLTLSELKGKKCYECWGLDRLCLDCPVTAAIQTGRPQEGELTPESEPHWPLVQGSWYIRSSPVRDDAGKIIGAIEAAHDISARKRAEKDLQELNTQLEQRVRERTEQLQIRAGQLARLTSELTMAEQHERQRLAQVLHDGLQQLLVAARFRLNILEKSTDEAVRAEARELGELLSDSIETSRSLTAELSPPVLKSGLVPALEWLIRWMETKYGLVVALDAPVDLAPLAENVKVFLFQSVRELLFNIVKHAGVKAASMTVVGNDARVAVRVEDRGRGFDPAKSQNTADQSGGLGLFAIRERLELLGGYLEIDSAPGRGSRLTLGVPEAAGKAIRSVSEPQSLTSVGFEFPTTPAGDESIVSLRIVLVDDHAVVRQGLGALLRQNAQLQIVGEASDGKSAIALVRRLQPDVVLMDISMPGMNGIEATRLIHQENPKVCIIGLSMHDDVLSGRKIIDAGAVAHLPKSGPVDSIAQAVLDCHGKSRGGV